MWSETVGLIGHKTGLRPKKIGLRDGLARLRSWSCGLDLGLADLRACCFVKHDLVMLVVIMKVKDTATFQVQ